MANLGRFQMTVRNSEGQPITTGVQISLLRQGATVLGAQSGGPGAFVIAVNNVGAALVGDSLGINEASGPGSATITAIALGQLTVDAGGVVTLNDDDRLRLRIASVSVYADAEGAEAVSQPMTTNANGFAAAWVAAGFYDVLLIVTGSPNILYQDVYVGGNFHIDNNFGGAADVAQVFDTLRVMANTGKLISLRNAGVEKFFVRADGKLAAHSSVGAITIDTGGLIVTAGGIVVTAGGMNITGASQINAADLKLRQKLLFGAAGVEDTNLYRNAADELKTDDALTVGGAFRAMGIVTSDLRITQLSKFETLALAATLNVSRNNVLITGTGGISIATINIDGLAPTAAHSGYPLFLKYNGTGTATLTESGGNITTENGGSIGLTVGQCVNFVWDDTASKWIQSTPKANHP